MPLRGNELPPPDAVKPPLRLAEWKDQFAYDTPLPGAVEVALGRDSPPVAKGDYFNQFIMKLHGHCNLACDYCYVYQMADTSWAAKDMQMSMDTFRQTASRVADHAYDHQLSEVRIIFHGGEPLLVGAEYLDEACTIMNNALFGTKAKARFSVQTNGILLDNPENLDVLNKHEIGVGVSIDGNRQTNDEHRKYRNGRGSFNNVVRGADRLRATHPLLFRAILCTVSLDADPIETYEAILEFSPPSIDLLLPHGNWDNPPPGREADSAATPYADWMLAIHDRQQRDRAARVSRTAAHIPPIRFLSAIQGGALVETIGLAKTTLIVVETDGSIEQVDTLKSAYQGAAETGLNVREHSFDQAMEHPGVQARRTGATALSATCQQCPILSDCGGGYYPHRYGQGSFQNPSVFCKDLLKIVRTVRGGA